MNKKSIILTGLLGLLFFALKSDIDGPAHHGHGDITGAPVGTAGHCQTSSCHGPNNPLTIVQLQVLDTATMLPITTYNAWQTYLVTIKGDATAVTSSLPGFGFQVSAVLGNHTLAGSYIIPAAAAHNIHTFACGATTVVEQTNTLSPDTAGINKYSVQFYWTAPPAMSDSVKFFTLLNAVNGDGGKPGDYPNAAPIVTIYENPTDTALTNVAMVSIQVNEFTVYPTCSHDDVTISYNLLSPTMVSIAIYDINGRKTAMVADNEFQSGRHTYHPVITAPGSYFVKLIAGSASSTRRFVKL